MSTEAEEAITDSTESLDDAQILKDEIDEIV